MSRKSKSLALVTQTQEFFHELVDEALKTKKYKPSTETQVYLVNLLNQFLSSDRLYTRDAEGNVKDEPLAILVKEALEQPEIEAQKSLFRYIGDVSLYTAGFFQDSLSRKVVDVDYYIGMGGTAYRQVAARIPEKPVQGLYQELAEEFPLWVDVLAEVSDKTTQKTETNLLRIYETWIRTKSERAAKTLKEAGILPNKTIKKDWQ